VISLRSIDRHELHCAAAAKRACRDRGRQQGKQDSAGQAIMRGVTRARVTRPEPGDSGVR